MERQSRAPSIIGRFFGGIVNSKRESFESLAEQVYPSMFNLAFRLTRSREEAEDLVQESVVRAYEAFDKFDGTNFRAWILRITTNAYINRYRHDQRIPASITLDDEKSFEPADLAELTPENLLFENALAPEIESALASLPEEFRMTVILSDLEGMTYQEVADATHVPVGTVRSRLARGRSMLRSRLAEFAQTEGYLRHGATE